MLRSNGFRIATNYSLCIVRHLNTNITMESNFHFEYLGVEAAGRADLICSGCGQAIVVRWDTYGGEHEDGEHSAECGNCDKVLTFKPRLEYDLV